MSQPLTFDDIWRLFQETDRRFQETERLLKESSQETERRFQETERLLKASNQDTERLMKGSGQETDRLLKESGLETDRRFQETERLIDRVSRRIGELGNRLGEFVEELVAPAVVGLFQARGIEVHEVHRRVEVNRGPVQLEIDLLVVNVSVCVLVEAKSKVGVEDVEEHLQRLAQFKEALPAYRGHRALGAVAGMVIPPEVARFAYRQGLFVLAQRGETMSILNDERFQPREW